MRRQVLVGRLSLGSRTECLKTSVDCLGATLSAESL